MQLTNDFTFHHLGIACESIVAESPIWKSLGYRPEGAPFTDETQGIRGLFMTGNGPRIELLEATDGSLTLAPWIKRQVKLYHMGYVVTSFDAAIENLLADGATVARSPSMSPYFKSRIVFLLLPNVVLIELIDAQHDCVSANPRMFP